MKRMTVLGLAFTMAALFLGGCATPSRAPVLGYIYTETTGGEMVTSNARALKTGTATCEAVLGVSTGDCSIATAMKNGRIKKIQSVDSKVKDILGIYVKYTVIVHGE